MVLAPWKYFKRPVETLICLLSLIVLSPLLLLVAAVIRSDGGPVFFMQERVGFNEKIFRIFKFRSMIVNADNFLDAKGMPTRQRVTRVGMFIRKTSIDELPQLINVIRGEMSLIGPRPILPRMLTYLNDSERMRFSVRPGITGLAQVKGRNEMLWSKRFELDVIYATNLSLFADLKLVLLTIPKVFIQSNITTDRNATQVDDITNRLKD